MKSTKEEIQTIKTLLKDSSTAKYHKRLQIVLFRLMGKPYKEIIQLLDCNQTTIWRNVKKYEELGLYSLLQETRGGRNHAYMTVEEEKAFLTRHLKAAEAGEFVTIFQAQAETVSQTVSLPNTKIILDRFHIVQHLSRAMSRVRVQIMNQFERKSHEYKIIKRYWKLIQQDSRKLSDKRFYRPTFRMHLTNKEILDKLLSYSEDLKHHYDLYQLLLFHFQNKEPDKFFGLIEDNLKLVHPLFQIVFKIFLKDKEKSVNALHLPYFNAKLEESNNLIKLIKRNAFGFRNFENFKKRIFIALNIKKERTKFVLSRAQLFFNPLQLTKIHHLVAI